MDAVPRCCCTCAPDKRHPDFQISLRGGKWGLVTPSWPHYPHAPTSEAGLQTPNPAGPLPSGKPLAGPQLLWLPLSLRCFWCLASWWGSCGHFPPGALLEPTPQSDSASASRDLLPPPTTGVFRVLWAAPCHSCSAWLYLSTPLPPALSFRRPALPHSQVSPAGKPSSSAFTGGGGQASRSLSKRPPRRRGAQRSPRRRPGALPVGLRALDRASLKFPGKLHRYPGAELCCPAGCSSTFHPEAPVEGVAEVHT